MKKAIWLLLSAQVLSIGALKASDTMTNTPLRRFFNGHEVKACITIARSATPVEVGKPRYPAELLDLSENHGMQIALYSGKWWWRKHFQVRGVLPGKVTKLMVIEVIWDYHNSKLLKTELLEVNSEAVTEMRGCGWRGDFIIKLDKGMIQTGDTGYRIVYDPNG